MMVDKTGVGPGGGPDPPVKSVSTDAAAGSHGSETPQTSPQQQPHGSVPLVKTSKSDDHHVPEKSQRSQSNQRWMKLRTTVQLSGAISSTIQKSKPQLKREDSFLKRFSTRQIPETQETMDTGDDGDDGSSSQGEPETQTLRRLRRRKRRKKQPTTVVNPDENFYYYWLLVVSICVLYNLWTLIVRQSFPELQQLATVTWFTCDSITDVVFILDIVVQFRTGYLEQGLMVYDSKKLATHYVKSRPFILDLVAMIPLQLLQFKIGTNPILRFPRFVKVYRVYDYYYMVESRTVYPNLWRVVNLIHILLILAHWFGCFYYLLSEAENFEGDWVYPYRPTTAYATLGRKYLGSLYWSTLTLTTIGDLPTPETNAEFVFTIVSYLIGVFIFATIVGQVGNVITNRNANRLEFERLLDGAKTYMRHHKVPSGMKRRVLRWYDYSWSRGRIQGGGDINTALGLLPDKLKTELALHVNLSVLKKVTIFQACQPEFLHDLVLKMKAYIFTPGDLICRKGEVAREMFIIADGILEVISETGHVLTTMMAGDFFGEIGILNLDGLNKRTADVRSVGYSELFSLSREDVLAAMKDYPEAQEILQRLGTQRLNEARSVTKAVIEHRKQAELKAMVQNAALASEHRSKTKIVERIYSDVKGLKSVLRKSRRGTNSEDSLELQPLTSIAGKTDNQSHGSSKGTLCRMQKVFSEDNECGEGSAPAPERRISAGFPLLNKLKTITQSNHHRQPSVRSDSSERTEQPKDEPEVEPIGAGLPLLQRLLLLKQKEDSEKSGGVGYVPSTVRTQHQQPICSSQSTSQHHKSKATKKEVAFAEDVLQKVDEPKSAKHEKREFMKPWCLLRKATINQNRHRDSKTKLRYDGSSTSASKSAGAATDDTVSAREGRNPVNPHRCLTRLYGSGMKSAQCTFPATQCAKMYDNTLVNINICDTSETGVQLSNSNCNNSNNNVIKVISSSNSASSGSSEVTDSSCSKCVNREDGEPSASGMARLQLPSAKRSAAAGQHPKTYDSVDDLSPEYTGLPFVKKLKILNERQKLAELEENAAAFVRSCSLDSSKGTVCVRTKKASAGLVRSSSEATATQMYDNAYSLQLQRRRDLPSPESCETLERRKLKSVLKRISSGGCKISDILRCTRPSSESGAAAANAVLGDVHWFRRLMNAQTVEGYVARHSTFEKSITCRGTLLSPPATEQTLKSAEGKEGKEFTFDESASTALIPISVDATEDGDAIRDAGERNKYIDRESSHSPSKNPDVIPEVDVIEEDSCCQLPIFTSQRLSASEGYGRLPSSPFSRDTFEGMQDTFRSQVKEIEQEVRKRDMLIEVLQTRIQELQKHHEECFHECSSSDDTDCDTPEPAFLRGDSVDTVLLSSSHMSCSTNQEYHRHIDQCSPEGQSTILLANRRSWEVPSEEDNLELRDLPTSMKPCPMWREDISIDIASDTSTSASETDELFGPLDDDLQLASHDQDWEVRMLARELEKRELEKREHNESQFYRQQKVADVPGRGGGSGGSGSGSVPKTQLLNVRSLEEQGSVNTAAPSQRSVSSDNIYYSSVVRHHSEPPFRTSSSLAVRTSSVSPDVVPLPVVTKSSPSGS